MILRILVCTGLLWIFPLQTQAQEQQQENYQDDLLLERVEISKVVSSLLLFFKVFGNNRGCVTGRVANYTAKKIVDENIEAKSLCLDKTNRANFTVSWELAHEKEYFSIRKNTFLKKNGSLVFSIKDKVLSVGIIGLRYKLFKGAIFKIKLFNFDENIQHVSVNSVGTLLPIKLTSNMKYMLEHFRFQYLHVLGLKIKLKLKS